MWPFGKGKKHEAHAAEPPAKPVDPRRRDRQEQAGAVIARYENEGWPFILYLRNFGHTMFHGDRNEGYLLWQYLQREAPDGCGVFMIDDQRDSRIDAFSTAYGRSTPLAFAYRNEDWQERFRWLMRHAAMIVDEYYVDTPGSTWELEQLAAAGCAEKTILLTPSPGGMFAALDTLDAVKPFWRGVFPGELENGNMLFGWRRAEDLHLRLVEICQAPARYRPNPDGSPATLPPLLLDLAVDELFRAADQPYSVVTRLPLDAEGRLLAEHRAGVAEALHIAYAHLQRYVAGLRQTALALRGGRLAPDEAHNLLMSELYSADMCLRARLQHTFKSVDAQIAAAKTHLVGAGQWLEKGAGMGEHPRAFWRELMGKAGAADQLWWTRQA